MDMIIAIIFTVLFGIGICYLDWGETSKREEVSRIVQCNCCGKFVQSKNCTWERYKGRDYYFCPDCDKDGASNLFVNVLKDWR